METLIDLVASAAANFGEAPAMTMRTGLRDQTWSYASLWRESRAVAYRLQQKGIGEGDRVLLLAPNSPQYVVSLIGIMLRRAIAVPLDFGSSNDFIGKVQIDTDAAVLISDTCRWMDKIVHIPFAELVTGVPAEYVGPSPGPRDIAEIVYTSGTTGNPKGIKLTHANIIANVLSSTAMVPPNRNWRLLSILPLSHMFEQTIGLFGPLMYGGLIHYGVSRQSAAIGNAMRRYRTNVIVVVPQLLSFMLQSIERGVRLNGHASWWEWAHRMAPQLPLTFRRLLFHRVHEQLGGKLAFFLVGGAYLPTDIELTWERLGIKVVQGYGATECAPLIAGNTQQSRCPGSVGSPVPNVEIRIQGDGEIQVRGPNVFSGYWNNDTATRAVLLKDGWYCTGDLGEFNSAGMLILKGRKKDMVALPSGLKVYLEDIEQVLNQQPKILESVVVDVARSNGEVIFTAVLHMEEDNFEAAGNAVRLANAQLAPYQRLSGFCIWDKQGFPHTAIGKLQRHSVRGWLEEREGSEQTALPSASSSVTPLQQILADLSGMNAASIAPETELTLDLGLSSLARVELALLIEENYKVIIDGAEIARAETVSQLDQLIRNGGSVDAGPEIPSWPLHGISSFSRRMLQALILFPIHRLVSHPFHVEGLENLKNLPLPAMFISNHSSHVDTVSIIRSLPSPIRSRLAVAAAQDYFFHKPLLSEMTSLMMNTFPFARSGNVRASLEYCGTLADMGWSLLIYPEGSRSESGALLPFKPGIGLLATKMHVPIVPIAVSGGREILPKGAYILKPGPVSVKFGTPLSFSEGDNPTEVTLRLQCAVAELMTA